MLASNPCHSIHTLILISENDSMVPVLRENLRIRAMLTDVEFMGPSNFAVSSTSDIKTEAKLAELDST